MSGRGRGRGGGGNKALVEQLGLQKSELIKEPSTGPPETFPSLQFRPVKVSDERSLDRAYMLVVKKELREYLQNSEYNIVLDTKKPDIERYSDRFHCLNNKSQLDLHWSRFPKELRPKASPTKEKKAGAKRKLAQAKVNVKSEKRRKTKDVDVKGKLEELEKKETTGEDEEKEKEEEKEEEEVVEEGEEDVDEEMDEGTDYINSYFDNGEDYIEEDGDAAQEEGGVF